MTSNFYLMLEIVDIAIKMSGLLCLLTILFGNTYVGQYNAFESCFMLHKGRFWLLFSFYYGQIPVRSILNDHIITCC